MARDDQDLHWKRVHQLAIVAICPDHGCDLRESLVAPDPNKRLLHPASAEVCGPNRPSLIPEDATVDRRASLDLARHARSLLQGGYPSGMARESGPGHVQLFRDLGYGRRSRLDWKKIAPAVQAAVADISPALPGVNPFEGLVEGWFVASMHVDRPGHADRVLIAAMILRRVEAIEPRFWAAFDQVTGQPLLRLEQAA